MMARELDSPRGRLRDSFMLLRHRLRGRKPCTAWPYQYKPSRFPNTYLAGYPHIWYGKFKPEEAAAAAAVEEAKAEAEAEANARVWFETTPETWESLRCLIEGARGRQSDAVIDAMLAELPVAPDEDDEGQRP